MQITKRAGLVLTGFALLFWLGTSPAQAQQPQPPTTPPPVEKAPVASQPKAPAPIEGELLDVDAEAKTLEVKTAAGTEVKFKYNDQTEITGVKDGAAGLATMKDGRVTVHFTEDAATKEKTATKIVIEPKQ